MTVYLVAKHVICDDVQEDWFLISAEKDLWSATVTYAQSFDPFDAGKIAARCCI